MFRKMPILLLAIIIFAVAISPHLSEGIKSILYTLSLTLKQIILFVLPLLIFGLLFKSAVRIAGQATTMILLLLVAICVSNFFSTLVSYQVGQVVYSFDLAMTLPQDIQPLLPAWTFSLPKWIGNDVAMFSGLFLGVVIGRWRPQLADKLLPQIEIGITVCLQTFLYLIPVFIFGFLVKMTHDQVMVHILQSYTQVFLLVACAVFSYIACVYLIANRLNASKLFQSVKNMMPAAFTGFGTMSSAAAMPLTLLGTEKNVGNPDVARLVIPATVNVHLVGDCFAIPIFAFAILKNFGFADPTFFSYVTFAGYFVLAKFSVAAVPGGGILVMLPILESTLGFNAEMLSLITALYILFDPIITCANIVGNGGFAMAIDRGLSMVSRSKKSIETCEKQF